MKKVFENVRLAARRLIRRDEYREYIFKRFKFNLIVQLRANEEICDQVLSTFDSPDFEKTGALTTLEECYLKSLKLLGYTRKEIREFAVYPVFTYKLKCVLLYENLKNINTRLKNTIAYLTESEF